MIPIIKNKLNILASAFNENNNAASFQKRALYALSKKHQQKNVWRETADLIYKRRQQNSKT